MDDCPCSEIPSEPSFALNYPGVSVVSSHSFLQQEANQNCSFLLHRLFPATHSSPLNSINFPKHKPKAWLIRESERALTDIGSACTPVKFLSLSFSPSGMSQCRTPSRGRSPSLPYLCGQDWSSAAGADMNIRTNQLREKEYFYKCLHIHLSWWGFCFTSLLWTVPRYFLLHMVVENYLFTNIIF